MENKEFYKYMELETVDGPLYLYEKYKEDPNKQFIPDSPITIREFFTGEEAKWNYDELLFLNGKCALDAKHYNSITGEFMDAYYHYINAQEFLEKVLPYIVEEETFQQKREEVLNILKYNANITKNRKIKRTPKKVSQEKKNEISEKILKKYMK